MTANLFDVVAVNIESSRVRLMAEGKTKANADAIIKMACYRRGVETEFYAAVPAGSHKEGNCYRGQEAAC